MQNSNPSPHVPSVPFPYSLSEALSRAYLRARDTSAGSAPSASDILAAFARGPEPEPPDQAAIEDSDPDAVAGYVDRAELLGVMRGPIAWVFALAARRAQNDPVDLAAIERVRDAALHRIDAIIAGAAPADAPRIRAADLLTVASLLVGTLDPAIVGRAAQVVGGGIADALTQLLPLAPMIAGEFAGTPGASAAPGMPGPVSPAACSHEQPSPSIWVGGPYPCGGPFAGALGGMFGGPIASPQVPRAVVPPWYWPHPLFAY